MSEARTPEQMLRIRFIMVGRTGKGPIADLADEYYQRVARMVPFETVVVAEGGRGTPDEQRGREGDALLATLRSGDVVVLLDEGGRSYTSVGFAERIGKWRDTGVRDLVFVIGGAYGFDPRVRARAAHVVALSSMTFTHQMVRPIFAEQLYRAFAILGGHPYHH